MIYHCNFFSNKGKTREGTFQLGICPVRKHEPITEHPKSFMKFTNKKYMTNFSDDDVTTKN